MSVKVIIIGGENIDKYAVAKKLQSLNDDLTIAPTFSSDITLQGKITENFIYYMSDKEVETSYKNNALMWVNSTDTISIGVTKPDMYSSDIFVMTYTDFNNISNPILNEFIDEDGIICFLDSKVNTKKDKTDSSMACERIFELPYLYFLDEDVEYIVKMILEYACGDDIEKEQIKNVLNN